MRTPETVEELAARAQAGRARLAARTWVDRAEPLLAMARRRTLGWMRRHSVGGLPARDAVQAAQARRQAAAREEEVWRLDRIMRQKGLPT